MGNWKQLLKRTVCDALDIGRCTIPEIEAIAWEEYPEELATAKDSLFSSALRTHIKGLLDSFINSDAVEQMTLPHVHLPHAIAIPNGEGFYYIRTDLATWSELLAGRNTREENLHAAQKKLDEYDDGLGLLRPYMEGTNLTVREAWAIHMSVENGATHAVAS